MSSIESLRTYVEGYPLGGRIPRHSHDWDQLALISESAAVVETDSVYVVHPLLKGLWLPAGVEHSIYSPRRFYLHALYFEAGSLRTDSDPQVLGLDNLARELILFLCGAPRASERGARHAHALALLEEILPGARPESSRCRARATTAHASSPTISRRSRTTGARSRSSRRRSAARAYGRSSVCSSRRRA